MDIVLMDPSLSYKGGAQRVMLDVAKKFNPIIYTTEYDKKIGFPEFSEFDIRIIKPIAPLPFFQALSNYDRRVMISIMSAWPFISYKIRDDYDIINANVVPSEWIRARNERVCWCCYSPIRSAFDKALYQKTYVNDATWFTEFCLENYLQIEKRIVPNIERIYTISPVVKERISRFLKRDDVEIVYPGVEPKNYSLTEYKKYFLYPSRIVPEKRMEMAIRAFKLFKKRGWKLIIAGFLSDSARDNAYFHFLKKEAHGTGIEFVISPDDKKMHGLYSNCYATLFCAIDEDWGLIPLESMASFKPCISVNEGGPIYSILDSKTGFLVNNAKEMAERMQYLANNPDVNEHMGKMGRKRVLENFTVKKYLDGVEKEFKATAKM